MVADGVIFALIGIGVILLLIPVSIRLLESVLLEGAESEPEPQYRTSQSHEREGGNAAR